MLLKQEIKRKFSSSSFFFGVTRSSMNSALEQHSGATRKPFFCKIQMKAAIAVT